ncbi:MAG: translation elongation factor Ts [Planctomycetota bacterium]
MGISAKDVNELRKSTGAGMMDCKKALEEAGGDIDGALEYLRKKGQKVAAKRADRDANEGTVVILQDGNRAAVLALSCETDFVAKNEGFIALANELFKLAFESGAKTKEDVAAIEVDGTTVAERLVTETGKTGEKIEVSDYEVVEGPNLATYIHAGSKIGVVLAYEDGGKDGADTFFRSVAMHVAAMNPSIMHPSEFDPELVEKETVSIREQIKIQNEDLQRLGKTLKNVPDYVSKLQLTPEVMAAKEAEIKEELKSEGKPEKIWDKIIPGKIERFVADNTLLDQERCLLSQFFALDDTKTVEAAVADFHPEAKVIAYKRVSVS